MDESKEMQTLVALVSVLLMKLGGKVVVTPGDLLEVKTQYDDLAVKSVGVDLVAELVVNGVPNEVPAE